MNSSAVPAELGRFHQCRMSMITLYAIHSTLVLGILIYGILQNGGDRKYVPVDPKGLVTLVKEELGEDVSCLKAYVDVHTSSMKDDIAFICCMKQGSDATNITLPDWQQYKSDICNPRAPYFNISMQVLPFSRRLTRFPEAWILPMLPILIRLVYQLISFFISLTFPAVKSSNPVKSPSIGSGLSSSSSSTVLEKVVLTTSIETSTPNANMQTPTHGRIRFTIQRILFYFIILNIRGWGLYIGANAIEDYVIVPWFTGSKVVSPLRTDSVSDVEHNIQSSDHDCWYKDVLKAHHRNEMESDYYSNCYGRPFDFSDHIVLFLAHYLPIFLMEMLYFWLYPMWAFKRMEQQQSHLKWIITKSYTVMHLALFIYMHLIVLHATYQTTAYFHTAAEVIVGYLVSLLLQGPILYLICSEKWSVLRRFIGLPVSQVVSRDASRGKIM